MSDLRHKKLSLYWQDYGRIRYFQKNVVKDNMVDPKSNMFQNINLFFPV